jgi:hypothetical protein
MLRRFVIAGVVLSTGLIGGTDDGISAPSSPSPEEQVAIISAARDAALLFSNSLPDFICTQVTRRWVGQSRKKFAMTSFGDPREFGSTKVTELNEAENLKLKDTLTVQLSYSGQKEQYKLLLVNGKRTKSSYESVGGVTSYGDFWSVLGIVFQPSSQTKFEWDHWAVLNGQKVMVFNLQVMPANSQWRISYELQEIVTGLKGFVFIEPTQREVLKIEVAAVAIPKKFPIQRSGVELDYRRQTVGGREFLLPLRAVDWNDATAISTKNEVEFRLYRRFTADSKIDFETPPALPEKQLKEATPE